MSVDLRSAARPARPRAGHIHLTQDAAALLVLGLLFLLLVALTWRKWGNPEIDAGAELTTADLVAHGDVPYRDVRYFYGPLGLYGLAGAFRLFGPSFTVAFAFGLAQAAAILGVFYALARHWLRPAGAGLATAVLLAIGFSGTAFNFVLPHTNSATIGLLCLLLQLLALTRGRLWLAGAAIGLVALTRPEFAAVAIAVAIAYVIGACRDAGRRTASAAALRLALPALAIAGAILGAFAAVAGANRLFTENLWPVDFIRQAGFRSQEHWMPFSLESLAGLVGRGAVYGLVLAGLVAGVVGWRESGRGGPQRLLAAVAPPAAAVAALLVLDVCVRAVGVFPDQRAAIEQEVHHLTIGMSWLPFLAAAVAVWAGARFVRRRPAPFSDSWAVDLALLAATTALGLRAYNAFTGEGSYAPYYAAPLVLLAGLLHQGVADRWPAARAAALAALGAVAFGLALYALVGLYADRTTPVHTARGTYVADRGSAPAIQAAVDVVRETTGPGDAILAAPSDGGLYFMTARRPALPELMLLPGLLDSPADELAAVRTLQRERVGLAVVGARDFTPFGSRTFGVDYNKRLGAWLREEAASSLVLGDLDAPAAGTYPSRGFEVLALLPHAAARLPAAAALQEANTAHTAPKPAMRTIQRPSRLPLISQAANVPRSPSAIFSRRLHRTPPKAAPSRQARRALLAATVAAVSLVASEGRAEAAPRPIVVDSVSELQAAVRRAPHGGTVYVRGGSYGSALLAAHRTGWVTIRPRLGATVSFADLNFSSTASYVRVKRVKVNEQVDLAPEGAHHIQILDSNVRGVSAKWGTHHLLIEHNSIHDCDNCVELVSTAANVPGSPDPSAANLPAVRHVTIRGNRIARPNTDALFLTNFRHVVVEGNEITGVIENGSHNDVLQTVWGGDGLVFRGNYVHDNRGQGFFIKDGRVSDVVVTNNLFVRVSGSFWQIQLYRTIGALIARNTVWNVDAPVVLQEGDNRRLAVRNNVFNGMVVEEGYESYYRNRAVLDQYRNVITGGWNWGARSRDRSVRPRFRAPARNDFRLVKAQVSRLGFRTGVSWRRAGHTFGPR